MKINVEIDCTPEEARRFMGLPDLAPVHDKYIATMLQTMDKGMSPELIDGLVRSWAPMGEAGLTMWRKLFDQAGTKPNG